MEYISIIVPVYNAEATLDRCLKSLVQQSHHFIEIILVNDGSTDKSEAICDFYKNKDSRVKVINQSNEGVSKARNIGIEHATSPYLLFVDSDDYVSLDYCEKLYKVMNSGNYDVALSGYERVFVFNNNISHVDIVLPSVVAINSFEEFKENWSKMFEKSFFNAPWAKLYSTEVIKENNIYFNEGLNCGEDLEFNLEVFKHIFKIGIVNEPLYFYECTEKDSLTNKFDPNKHSNDKYLYNLTVAYLEQLNMLEYGISSVTLIYLRSCFRTLEQLFVKKEKTLILNKRKKFKEILAAKETNDSLKYKKIYNIESLIYYCILKTNLYFVSNLFTKVRYKYKIFVRKGFKI